MAWSAVRLEFTSNRHYWLIRLHFKTMIMVHTWLLSVVYIRRNVYTWSAMGASWPKPGLQWCATPSGGVLIIKTRWLLRLFALIAKSGLAIHQLKATGIGIWHCHEIVRWEIGGHIDKNPGNYSFVAKACVLKNLKTAQWSDQRMQWRHSNNDIVATAATTMAAVSQSGGTESTESARVADGSSTAGMSSEHERSRGNTIRSYFRGKAPSIIYSIVAESKKSWFYF